MKRITIVLTAAVLAGCTGTQIKNSAVGITGVVARGLIQSVADKPARERDLRHCQEAGKTKFECGATQMQRDRERQQARVARERARERKSRESGREYQEYFEETFRPMVVEQIALNARPDKYCASVMVNGCGDKIE